MYMLGTNSRGSVALLLLMIGAMLSGCSENEELLTGTNWSDDRSTELKVSGKLSVTETEKRMEELSGALAEVLGKPSALSVLKGSLDEAAKHQVVLSEFLTARANGSTIGSDMATKMGLSTNEVLHLVKSIPNLEISLPVHYSEWDGHAPLLATFAPPRDELEVSEIVAFQSPPGDCLSISAEDAPETATLVLAIDEDTPPPLARSLDSDYWLVLTEMNLQNDHEPWYKGDPEICVKCQWQGGGGWSRTDVPEVNG